MPKGDLPGAHPVDPVSEAMFVMETDVCPVNLISYVSFRGRPDLEACRTAVRRVQQAFPATVSRFQERRSGLRYALLRVPVEDPPPLEVLEDLGDLSGRTVLEALSDKFEPRFAQRVDLFAEAPVRFYLARFPDDLFALVIFWHHAIFDGASLTAAFRTFFAAYHRIMTGAEPEWASVEDLPSSAPREIRSSGIAAMFRDMISEAGMRRRHPLIRLGNADPITSARRHLLSMSLTEEETLSVSRSARQFGVTFNDLLCVSAVQAIDELLGTPEGTQSIWLPVNARASTGRGNGTNHTTSINIDLIASDRVDPWVLLRKFAARRRALLEKGRDAAALRLLEGLLGVAHLFPDRIRRPRLKKIMSAPTTFMVSNLGVLWPRREGGRLTPHSAMTVAGGLEIEDFAMDFPTNDSVGYAIVAYTHNGRFRALFSAYRDVMERSYAEGFLNIVRRRLVGWARPSSANPA